MEMKVKFESVVVRDVWGRFDADGFHLNESAYRRPYSGITFSICRISQEIAVVFDQELSAETRSHMASSKPDWLDAIVHAELASNPADRIAAINAEVLYGVDSDLAKYAFAVACVAFDQGLFEVVPEHYLISLGQRTMQVTMDFDNESESWFGEVI
jgi:hypothetical protein